MKNRILLVDDEPAMLTLVSHGLRKRGYEVFTGRNGGEALALASQLMPDLIILDVYMPVMDGDKVILILKNDARLKNIPVFLISAVPKGLGEKSAACGADAWFTEPFDLDELTGMIKKHCEPDKPPHK